MAHEAKDPGKLLYSVSIGLIVSGLLIGFAVLPRTFTAHEPANVGKEAPDFTVPVVHNADVLPGAPAALAIGTASGATKLTLSSLRGHPVVLDFWATWCGPCRAEAPMLDRVARRYKDRGLMVVGVNTSDEDGLAAPFALKHGLSFPIAFDDGNRAAHAYAVESLPTLVVIGRDGKVVAVRTGVTDDAELERMVTSAL